MSWIEVIAEFDDSKRKGYTEYDIESKLRSIKTDDNTTEADLLAELMAFGFVEDYPDDSLQWGTYFGPMMVMPDGKGKTSIYPALQLVNETMINYWTERGREAHNPILEARYFGLVYDFQETVIGSKPDHKICRSYVKSLLDIAKYEYIQHEKSVYTKLKRALELSIGLNDGKLIEECKHTILKYEENQIVKRDSPFLGKSFDLLIQQKKIKLSDQEEELIISRLKDSLSSLSQSSKKNANPWQVEQIVRRLAKHYRRKGEFEKIPVVLESARKEYEKIISDTADMQQINWLRQIHSLYAEFNQPEAADEILRKMREVGPEIKDSMHEISHSFDISAEDLKKFCDDMTSGSLEDTLIRFAVHFIPRIEETKKQLLELSENSPLTYMITNQLFDEKGRVLATINPLSEDLNGHLIRQISMNLQFSSIFVRKVIEAIRVKFRLGPKRILNYLEESPLIDVGRISIIGLGVKAYLRNDHITATHLLIPQIEEAMRIIVETGGGAVLRENRAGGYNLKTFDDILRDPIIIRSIGEDLSFYLRVLFTDVRGWNLRNTVSHGIASKEAFNQQTSDRVFHALMCLRLIIKKEGDSETKQ
jgi:hypothetical protein